jgi:RHS repeat-associated protein
VRRKPSVSRALCIGVATVVTVGVVIAGGTTQAVAASGGTKGKPDLWSPSPLPTTRSVDVTPATAPAPAGRATRQATAAMPAFHATAPRWPSGRSTVVRPAAAGATAAGTPVTLAPAGHFTARRLPAGHALRAAATPGSVGVTVAGQDVSRRAGVNGLIVSLGRTDRTTAAGTVSMALDYSSIKDAYGGDYASRLRLVQLPACALTTPQLAACQTQIPVAASANDLAGHRLVADLALPDQPAVIAPQAGSAAVVLAAVAAPDGTAGTYSATSLAPSGKWGESGNTGAFTYSYPLTIPPSVGGDAPEISLDYNSASVDGRTSATNNQASWIGDGWDYHPGFIERTYRTCSDDGQSGDLDECWAGDVDTLSLPGHSGDLVPAGSGTWRLADDDGSLIEELSGASNGLDDGTYWRLTTNDGTQYYFGADHLPTAAGGTGTDTSTDSAWGLPVYGNNSGEPCHASTFDASECTQGYRWNLDFVVDPHKNITTYAYKTEPNYYGRGSTHTLTKYTRGGYPATISYGQSVTDYVAKANPAAQIVFTAAQRCDGLGGVDCTKAPTSSTASHWPDVPFDQNCASSGTCANHSPSFWSTMRLATVTTKVWDESLATPGWSSVDTYTLGQTYPAPGDGTKPAMWLSTVKHTGSDTRGGGSAASLPALTLTGQATLPNRVDGLETPQDIPPIDRYRLQSLTTETGEQITVAYRNEPCSRTSPPAEDADTAQCYPVRWTPPGYADPILDWFYVYPVSEVDENDLAASGSPSTVTTYDYQGGAAWHHDDSEITTAKYRTWGEFRGYARVVTRKGKAPDPVTETATDYLRGMDGDATKAGGTATVKVTDALGRTLTDDDALSGFVYQTTTYDKDGGTPQSQTVDHPWLSPATATHARSGSLPDQVARYSDTDISDTRQLKADGSWRTAETTTAFDGATGLTLREDDKGEVDGGGTPVAGADTPEKCVSTAYASDPARNMRDFPSEVITEAGPCVTAPDAHTLADTRTWYDKAATGKITGPGDATSTQTAKDVSGATVTWTAAATKTYDTYGRVTGTSDPLGRTSSTSYGSTATLQKYLPVSTVTKNAATWATTTTFDPGRQLPLTTTDPNGRLTTETYDGLGRLTNVWLPDHTRAANPATPNDKFGYVISQTAPSTVETQTLRDGGDYSTDYQIFDAMLRLRQDQDTPKNDATGRLISDTAYDSHGWTVAADAAFYNGDAAPSPGLVTPVPAQVPSATRTSYDGQGRVLSAAQYSLGTRQWSTDHTYPGADETDTVPPQGGTPTAVITNARGEQRELRQFHGTSAAGAYDRTVYGHRADDKVVSETGPLPSDADPAGAAGLAVTWTTGYDLLGNTTRVTDPDTGVVTRTYDDDGEMITSTDNSGTHTIGYSYDVLGRKTHQYDGDPATGTVRDNWTYDPANAKGQPATATEYSAAGATEYSSAITGYTTGYKPTGTSVTVAAGAYGNTAALSFTTTNTYTAVQDLPYTTKISTGGTGGLIPDETLTYGYNGEGDPVSLGGADTYASWIDYSPLGQNIRSTMGVKPQQVVATDSWEQATGRLLTHTVDKEDGTTAVDTVGYTYDPDGQITSVKDVQGAGGTAGTDTQCFSYDYLQRLTEAWTDTGGTSTAASPSVAGIGGCDHTTPAAADLGGPAPYWQTYHYDLTGDRTSRTDHDPSGDTAKDATTTETYDTVDHTHAVHTATTGTTTRTYAYDPDGNPVTVATSEAGQDDAAKAQKLVWTNDGHLDSLTTGPAADPAHATSYHYDPDGNLAARTDDGTTTVYLGSDEVTLSASGAVSADVRYYSLDGAPTAVRSAKAGTAGTVLSFQFADPHGTAEDDISADGLAVQRRMFTPFGEERATASAWPGDKGFVGGVQDDTTGLVDLGAREYDPSLGRFISPDPLLDTDDPQQWNGYAYSDNDPVNASDPTGRMLACGAATIDDIPCPTHKPPAKHKKKKSKPTHHYNNSDTQSVYHNWTSAAGCAGKGYSPKVCAALNGLVVGGSTIHGTVAGLGSKWKAMRKVFNDPETSPKQLDKAIKELATFLKNPGNLKLATASLGSKEVQIAGRTFGSKIPGFAPKIAKWAPVAAIPLTAWSNWQGTHDVAETVTETAVDTGIGWGAAEGGALIGASIGSAVPGVGTAVGALVGGVAGVVGASLANNVIGKAWHHIHLW